jgi:hypothetical protein
VMLPSASDVFTVRARGTRRPRFGLIGSAVDTPFRRFDWLMGAE